MKHFLMGVYQVCANKSPGGWGGLYTGERPQGHHGPLVFGFVRAMSLAF
jgi:hypothetical protein